MESYRELKEIGNEYMPIRLYNISIDKYNDINIETLSGFGNKTENEVCTRPCLCPHWHSYFEIIYFTEGNANMQINNEYFSVSQGDIVLIDAYDIHDVIGKCNHLVINIEPSHIFHVKNNFDDIFPKLLEGKWVRSANSNDFYFTLLKDIKSVFDLYKDKPCGYSLRVIGKIYEILGYVQNHSYKNNKDNFKKVIKKDDLNRIRLVIDYINLNYNNQISIEEVSDVINFSPTYFCRFFKKNMGKTFFEYLNYYRCLQAEILLNTTSKTITEIALEVGFNSTSYFSKVYKKLKGYKPSKENKKNPA